MGNESEKKLDEIIGPRVHHTEMIFSEESFLANQLSYWLFRAQF